MSDFRDLMGDPRHRRRFEMLLRLAAKRGDADLVVERLSWGIDPNGTSKRGRTALIANCRGHSPNVATVKALLAAGADPTLTDIKGLTALDYVRRKLARIQSHPPRAPVKSPSLDENNQLQLGPEEQEELDKLREEISGTPEEKVEYFRMFWKERLRAARRTFNDPGEIEQIVEILEGVGKS